MHGQNHNKSVYYNLWFVVYYAKHPPYIQNFFFLKWSLRASTDCHNSIPETFRVNRWRQGIKPSRAIGPRTKAVYLKEEIKWTWWKRKQRPKKRLSQEH